MWNGKEWDVYSPDPAFAGSAFGKPGTRGLKSKYGNMFDNIKTGFGEGNITGGITGIVTGIAGATNKQMSDNVDKIFDDYNKNKKISKTLGSKTSTRIKPKTETQLKNLGINKTKPVASANQTQTQTQTSTSDDDDRFREKKDNNKKKKE